MKTAVVFLADGFEEIEALSPVDYLRRSGVNVTTVGVPSPTTKETKDFFLVTSSHNIPVIADTDLKTYLENLKELPDCVILPGGSVGADNLSSTPTLLSHLEEVWDNNKIVAAICASPAVVLGKTKIPTNKTWTCYPGMEGESKDSYVPHYVNKVVVKDGNLITSRGPGASEEFAMEIVKTLMGKEVYEKIHSGTQQR